MLLATMARMDAAAVGSVRTQVESDLAKVQNVLAVSKEARWKAKKASRLAVERVSLLLELKTCKDEVSAIRAKALKEKNALEEAYEEGFDVIFNYGYGCCAFAILKPQQMFFQWVSCCKFRWSRV